MEPVEKNGETVFNGSKKYIKNGVPVVLLKGSHYETGYARGVLLKEELQEWTVENLTMIKRIALGNIGLSKLHSRAEELNEFIPDQYREELKGLSAGSAIDYDTLLLLNVLDTIARQYACTSAAVRNENGSVLRSRNLDFKDFKYFRPSFLVISQPENGNAFASLGPPGIVGVLTAMNEKGLTFGVHDIFAAGPEWRGVPAGLLYRSVVEKADTVDEAAQLMRNAKRSIAQMALVTDPEGAAVFEFTQDQFETIPMTESRLILTNHTRAIDEGRMFENSTNRLKDVAYFLEQAGNRVNLDTLVELNRRPLISREETPTSSVNIHSAVFNSNTLDFRIAIDPPPAAKGRWHEFNLKRELDYRIGTCFLRSRIAEGVFGC
ncbi:MAG: C45 family autoproteolytic acyltransferase/hydrolase, partial [Syntrophobacteria bacterium]